MSKYFNPGSAIAGLSTGLRAMTATSVTLGTGKSAWTGLAGTLAAGELLGDKLPMTPARTGPVGLLGRFALGAFCGSMLAKRAGRCEIAGAVVGASAALAATFAGYGIRKNVVAKLGIPDAVVAVAEDGIAFGLARLANA